jgi:hypothetical protein
MEVFASVIACWRSTESAAVEVGLSGDSTASSNWKESFLMCLKIGEKR